jgi:hypothetical protein
MGDSRRSALWLAAALLAVAGAVVPAVASAQSSQLAIRLTPARAFMGDVIAIEADVVHAEGARVSVPRGMKLRPFEVLRRRTRKEELSDGRIKTTVRIELVTFEMGEHVVPSIELRLVEASGQVRTLRTDPGRVTIAGRLDGVEQAEPKPHHGPVPVLEPRTWPLWLALALFGALVVAVVAIWLARRYARLHPPAVPAEPPRPPWDIALEKLVAIRAKGLAAQGMTKEHYDAVSDVVREYLGALGAYPGLDYTTEEILAAVRRTPPAGVTYAELAGFFAECDLVKFAKASATPDQAAALVDLAAGVVQRTRAALVPATATGAGSGVGPGAPPPGPGGTAAPPAGPGTAAPPGPGAPPPPAQVPA